MAKAMLALGKLSFAEISAVSGLSVEEIKRFKLKKCIKREQKILFSFFCLNYSATHAVKHNTIYVLDALDAYNKKLVKKIEVKGFEVKNFRGTDSYLYLGQIILSPKKPPMARIEFEIKYNKSTKRENRILGVGDNLYYVSQEMEQYKGYSISEIDPSSGTETFTNGVVIKTGEVVGDISPPPKKTQLDSPKKDSSCFKHYPKKLMK